jgi:heme-degrading monooxygenase HmoA
MIAVIFEVWPAEGQREAYLDIAREMRAMLDGIDGFISIERFASLSEDGKLLSLSFWRDEAAVARCRALPPHRGAQQSGRNGIFRDYRLRVAEVIRDYGLNERAEAPRDSRAIHDGDN